MYDRCSVTHQGPPSGAVVGPRPVSAVNGLTVSHGICAANRQLDAVSHRRQPLPSPGAHSRGYRVADRVFPAANHARDGLRVTAEKLLDQLSSFVREGLLTLLRFGVPVATHGSSDFPQISCEPSAKSTHAEMEPEQHAFPEGKLALIRFRDQFCHSFAASYHGAALAQSLLRQSAKPRRAR